MKTQEFNYNGKDYKCEIEKPFVTVYSEGKVHKFEINESEEFVSLDEIEKKLFGILPDNGRSCILKS